MAKQIERKPIDSSMLRAVGYDPEHQVLQAEFHSGQVWNYVNVPPSKYDVFLAADSKGRFMHDHILGYYAEVKIIKKKTTEKKVKTKETKAKKVKKASTS